MGLTIPSSKNKRYLSGFDWAMGIIDSMMKDTTSAGNIAQTVFVLNSRIDEAALRNHLSRFVKRLRSSVIFRICMTVSSYPVAP